VSKCLLKPSEVAVHFSNNLCIHHFEENMLSMERKLLFFLLSFFSDICLPNIPVHLKNMKRRK
jgi:hypothetical protein